MRILQILNLLLLIVPLSGCWTLGVSKDAAPGQIGDTDLLDSLIGQKRENVIRELGLPGELLSDGDKQFMMYSARGTGTDMLMIVWIPIPVATASSDILHCLRIELDSDNLVKDHRIKSKAVDMLVLFNDVELNSNCREVFWSKRELKKLEITRDRTPEWLEVVRQEKEIEKQRQEQERRQQEEEHRQQMEEFLRQAKKGNADAQLALFRELHKIQPEVGLTWLCRSADSGNQQARVILANLLAYGRHAWIKQDIVERNYILAYVWHGLSEQYDHEDLQFFADRYLTSEEKLHAEKMLKEWQPGNCERQLGLEGDQLRNIN
ncbi:MAG: hypothetical protein OES20_15710 [Gammaproteobacteria bacterium]|nr:hypothetical protein [Gammaproteobacteria bacterium]